MLLWQDVNLILNLNYRKKEKKKKKKRKKKKRKKEKKEKKKELSFNPYLLLTNCSIHK